MRKSISLIILLLAFCTESGSLYAQAKRFPLPDWVFEKPQRSNITFYYHVEKGTGETENDARNAAYTQAFMQVALKLGIPLNTEDISEAIASGTNVKMLSQRFTIPMNVVCYCSRRNEEIGGWNYWLLCQIPEMGYADRARFDDFTDCYKHARYDSIMNNKKKEEDAAIHRANVKAITASAFIPGLGQMLKGKGGAGAGILLGELALFGGGTTSYFISKNQAEIMAARGTSYEAYNTAKSTKNTCDIVMYACYGAGAALYVFNLCNAYLTKPTEKGLKRLSFAPILIPTNEFTHPTYAMGVGLQYNF